MSTTTTVTTDASSTTTTVTTDTSIPTPTIQPASPNEAVGDPPGLSTGAKATIGSVLGAIAIALFVVLARVYWRRRKRAGWAGPATVGQQGNEGGSGGGGRNGGGTNVEERREMAVLPSNQDQTSGGAEQQYQEYYQPDERQA